MLTRRYTADVFLSAIEKPGRGTEFLLCHYQRRFVFQKPGFSKSPCGGGRSRSFFNAHPAFQIRGYDALCNSIYMLSYVLTNARKGPSGGIKNYGIDITKANTWSPWNGPLA